jgi:trigger factor
MNMGDKKNIKVTFPGDYHEKTLAGREAVFEIVLHEIKEKQLPALDDEFAKDVSEFETLSAYKDYIKDTLQSRYDDQCAAEMENALVDKIVSLHEFDIPDAMTEVQINRKIHETEYRLMYQGLRLDQYLKTMGMTRDDLKNDYREPAKKSVKTRLVLEGIVREKKLDATEKEIGEKIKEDAKTAKKTEKEYRESLGENGLDSIKNDIMFRKLTDFLKANNTFSENAPEEKISKKTEAKTVKTTAAKMTASKTKKENK